MAPEARSIEARSVEARSVEARSVEARSVEARSVEARSVEARSVEARTRSELSARAARRWAQLWQGSVSPRPLSLFRIGLGLLVVLRTTDWSAPLFAMDHHRWIRGVEFLPAAETILEPALHSPLLRFIPALPTAVLSALAYARPLLGLLLVTGLRPRLVAALLASAGYLLLAVDRYHYFHHTHLLWLSVGIYCLAAPAEAHPRGRRARASTWASGATVPRWPLQLLRFHAIVIYLAAGLAKLHPNWLSGRAFQAWSQADLLHFQGFFAAIARQPLGATTLAWTTLLLELAIPLGLTHKRTRLPAIALALLLHAALQHALTVSIFGATMALYLMLFLPWPESPAPRSP